MKRRTLLSIVTLALVGGVWLSLWRLDDGSSSSKRFAGQGAGDIDHPSVQTPAEAFPSARRNTNLHGSGNLWSAQVRRRGADEYRPSRNSLIDLHPGDFLEAWAKVAAGTETDDLPMAIYALAERLRVAGNDAVYAELAITLYDPQATPAARERVLTLFGLTATPAAARALTDYLLSGEPTAELDAVLRDSLLEVAYAPSEGERRRELGSAFAETWDKLDASAPVTDAAVIAQALASLGTAEGAQVLLNTLLGPGRGDAERRGIAAAALGQLHDDEAVPVLASALSAPGRDAETTWAAIAGLVSIDSADAYAALLDGIGRTDALDNRGLGRLQDLLHARVVSDEAARVLRDALERRTVPDARIATLLDDVLAAHDRGQPDETD